MFNIGQLIFDIYIKLLLISPCFRGVWVDLDDLAILLEVFIVYGGFFCILALIVIPLFLTVVGKFFHIILVDLGVCFNSKVVNVLFMLKFFCLWVRRFFITFGIFFGLFFLLGVVLVYYVYGSYAELGAFQSLVFILKVHFGSCLWCLCRFFFFIFHRASFFVSVVILVILVVMYWVIYLYICMFNKKFSINSSTELGWHLYISRVLIFLLDICRWFLIFFSCSIIYKFGALYMADIFFEGCLWKMYGNANIFTCVGSPIIYIFFVVVAYVFGCVFFPKLGYYFSVFFFSFVLFYCLFLIVFLILS